MHLWGRFCTDIFSNVDVDAIDIFAQFIYFNFVSKISITFVLV